MADEFADFTVTQDGDFGDVSYDFNEADFNYAAPEAGWWENVPQQNNEYQFGMQEPQMSFAPGSTDYSMSQMLNPNMSMPQTTPDTFSGWGAAGGGVSQTLKDIFSNPATTKLLGALAEGQQNRRYAGNLQNLVNQNRQMLDPFGSQRGFYQGQLQQAVQNPYQAAIVRDQVNQIAQAQARKDAAAGRRSNMATSSPAMLAAQAQIAQQYMNSLMTPAGAGFGPQGGAALQALLPGAKAQAQGYLSPLASAAGNIQQTNTLQDLIGALRGK